MPQRTRVHRYPAHCAPGQTQGSSWNQGSHQARKLPALQNVSNVPITASETEGWGPLPGPLTPGLYLGQGELRIQTGRLYV